MVKSLPANAGDAGSFPGSGRSPGEGNSNPLQYPHLGNPKDRGFIVGYIVGRLYSPWDHKSIHMT